MPQGFLRNRPIMNQFIQDERALYEPQTVPDRSKDDNHKRLLSYARTWIRGRADLTPNARIVLTCMAGRHDPGRWRRRRDIQGMARLSDDLTIDALNELLAAGLVEKQERPGTRWPIPFYRPRIAARITLPGWWTSRAVSNDVRFLLLVMEGWFAPSIRELRPYTATPKRPAGWSPRRLRAILKKAHAARDDCRDSEGRYEAHRYTLPATVVPNAPTFAPPSRKVDARSVPGSSTTSRSREFSSRSKPGSYHKNKTRIQHRAPRRTPEGQEVYWSSRPSTDDVLSMAHAIQHQITGAPTTAALQGLVYNFGYAPAYLLQRAHYVRQQRRTENAANYFLKAAHAYWWATEAPKKAASDAKTQWVSWSCPRCHYEWVMPAGSSAMTCKSCGADAGGASQTSPDPVSDSRALCAGGSTPNEE